MALLGVARGEEPSDQGPSAVDVARTLTDKEQAQLDEAGAKNARAIQLYDAGRFAEGIPLAEEVLAIRKRVLGEQHRDYAASLYNLASLHQALGNYVRARTLFSEASSIFKQVLGNEHPDYATCLNNLALAHRQLGEFVQAERLYREALAIDRAALGEQHPGFAIDLNNLAGLYVAMGEHKRAEPLLRQALTINKEVFGDDHPAYARSLNNLAELHREAGRYGQALPLMRTATNVFLRTLGETHPEYATSLSNLALLYESMGDAARAQPLYEHALQIRGQALGERHPDYATSLNNLALLHESLGAYAQALPLMQQALAIRREVLGEQHPDVAVALNNLAILHRSQGDDAQAEMCLRQALDVDRATFGESHPTYAVDLSNLAELYRARGEYAQAEPLHRRAAAIFQAELGDDHPVYATSLGNLALAYRGLGDAARAQPLYLEALAIADRLATATAIAQDEMGQLRLSRNLKAFLDGYLSCALEAGGRPAAAYQATVAWKGATHMRQRLARIAADNPEIATTLTELQSVVRPWSAMVLSAPPGDSLRQQRLAELGARKEELEAELSRRSADFREATGAFEITALQARLPRGAALVDYYEYVRTQPSKDDPGALDARRSIVAFVVRPEGDVQMFDLGPAEAIHAAIDAWRKSYGLSAEAQEAGRLLRERLWTPLEAAVGDASLVLISPDGALGKLPFAALPGRDAGTYLIEDVAVALAPAPRLIPSLLAAADGRAAAVERELLVVGGVDYDRRDDGGAAPARDESELLAAATSRGMAVQTAAGLRWSALPGTRGEADAIERLFAADGAAGGVAMLAGAAATEEAFRRLAPSSRVLHVATHGFFAPEGRRSAAAADESDAETSLSSGENRVSERLGYGRFPPGLLSGLVLAGANDRIELPDEMADFATLPEDGILTAEELAFLPLGNVRLAVLSACETGLGAAAGGEGLLGIQRAFQISGVRTTIASLWKVDDRMTQRLMTAFYRNVLEGQQSYLDALRNAQLELLRELRDPARREEALAETVRGADAPVDAAALAQGAPYYWAAFTLSGDWR